MHDTAFLYSFLIFWIPKTQTSKCHKKERCLSTTRSTAEGVSSIFCTLEEMSSDLRQKHPSWLISFNISFKWTISNPLAVVADTLLLSNCEEKSNQATKNNRKELYCILSFNDWEKVCGKYSVWVNDSSMSGSLFKSPPSLNNDLTRCLFSVYSLVRLSLREWCFQTFRSHLLGR